MFPNPQDALPLPASPSIDQYRKLAKDLVKACHAREIAAWADRWMASLLTGWDPRHVNRAAQEVEDFALRALQREDRRCVLADAQFVIARSHGFTSWAVFVAHLEALAHTATHAAIFEAAVDAIERAAMLALHEVLLQILAMIKACI